MVVEIEGIPGVFVSSWEEEQGGQITGVSEFSLVGKASKEKEGAKEKMAEWTSTICAV